MSRPKAHQSSAKKKQQSVGGQASCSGTEKLSGTRYDRLLDHYLVLFLFLALVALTLVSADMPLLVGLLGLALCVAGIVQRPSKVDLWVLIPLIIYQVFSFISSYLTYKGISIGLIAGFETSQMFNPIIYLLLACLSREEHLWLKRLCVAWAGCISAVGLVQFLIPALAGRASRLGGVVGGPNTLGIYLVVAWFILYHCTGEQGDEKPVWLVRLEPLLLSALALTLSMGSFVAMAAGILFLACVRLRRDGPVRETLHFICGLLARATLGIGLGVVMYVAARRSGQPWLCIPLMLYLLALCWYWDRVLAFLRDLPVAAVMLTGVGVLVAAATVLCRPNAVATFQERLAMMRNGIGYLTTRPLWGLGPYQWQLWNYYDNDLYFHTSHIHNVLLHIGVERGLPAMAMAFIVVVRGFCKKTEPGDKAGFLAFVVHNMMDTAFFYPGFTVMTLMGVTEPGSGGKKIPAAAVRLVFALCSVVYLMYILYGFGLI